MAFDGCSSVKVPDTERNRSWPGRLTAVRGVTGYPAVELMTLAETGTRALIGAVFGRPTTGETEHAGRLLHLLDNTMLVLMDRGFDAGQFACEVAATRARFLVRADHPAPPAGDGPARRPTVADAGSASNEPGHNCQF